MECTGRCCVRHPKACTHDRVHIIFASKHPERGATLVRGTQVAADMPGAIALGGSDVHRVCEMLGHAHAGVNGKAGCARRSRSLTVVHLKDLSKALFASLPYAVHLLDPIDKIYRGFAVPTDLRLCGMIAHSAAQAELYRAHGVRAAWVVPDHGLPGCEAHADAEHRWASGHAAVPRRAFDRSSVLVMGGAPSSALRAALSAWARGRRARLLYEKDLRSQMVFSQSEGWSSWLCNLLRHNVSVAVAWDQISGLAFEADCAAHMGLARADCFSLKPAERFIVPLSAGVPTIGFPYPSFREAARSRTSLRASKLLLANDLDDLTLRLDALTSNFTHWETVRGYAASVGAAHSMRAVRATYEGVLRAAARMKAPNQRCEEQATAVPKS